MELQPLTKSELEVMGVLWEADASLKPGEIQDRFPRPIQNAALRSLLLVLLEKGHVARERHGRAFVYRAQTPQQPELRRMTRRLAEIFAGGSVRALIATMVKEEQLTPDEIETLRTIAEDAKEKDA